MKKSMTLLATSLFALYGCGGGGGSSSSGSTGTTQFDYPINNSQFAPKNITLLSYLISEDGGENIALDIAYRDISSQQMLANIQLELDKLAISNETEGVAELEKLKTTLESMVNSGINDFYAADMTVQGETDSGLFYKGNDGFVNSVDSNIELTNGEAVDFLVTNPVFKSSGSTVKEKSPNISHSSSSVGLSFEVTTGQLEALLDDFYEGDIDDLGSLDTRCDFHWQQQVSENGQRSAVTVQDKKIETAYLKVENTYNVVCDGYDSAEFQSNTETWFNPSFGVVKMMDWDEKNGTQLNETTWTLDSFTVNKG